jgi:organic radical activating enzyme
MKVKKVAELNDIIFPDIREYDNNLILYGAGVNGLLALYALEKSNIRILGICDDNPQKAGSDFCGYVVMSIKEAIFKYPKAAVMVDVYNWRSAYSQLNLAGFRQIISVLPLLLDIELDDAAKFCAIHFDGNIGTSDDGYLAPAIDAALIYEWISNYMIRGLQFFEKEPIYSQAINLDITNRCTLRCKGCLGFKSYYRNSGEDLSTEQILTTVDRLIALNHFKYWHILGGEPFLRHDLNKIIEKLVAESIVSDVDIITNATVMPDKIHLNSLQDSKVLVRISDYGELSYNSDKLEKLCAENLINCRRLAQRWQDLSVRPLALNATDTKNQFDLCCQNKGSYFYILKGKIYLCPFAAHTEQLGVYLPNPEDSVDLLAEPFSLADTEENIKQLYKRETPLKACRYCNGWSHLTPYITVAEQLGNEAPILRKFTE